MSLYPKDSAARKLTKAVPVVGLGETVAQVETLLRSRATEFDTINYVYVVDAAKKLVGVISIKEILRLGGNVPIKESMVKASVFVRPHTDQEKVAQLALEHSLKAIPVVDKDHVFQGVVPSDVILEILNQEHTEDVMRFAGVSRQHGDRSAVDVLLRAPSRTHVKLRLPWLVLGLLGGVGAAAVVEQFEATLADQLILAAFIPAIVYMADAVGSQTQMLFVRSLALDQRLNIKSYLVREVMVNFVLGLILAGLIFIISLVWVGVFTVSLILAVSVFLTVWFTVLVAIMLPWLFSRLGHDPAIASGPLATVVRDIASLLIYLGVASALI
jgi:magnesium transporter